MFRGLDRLDGSAAVAARRGAAGRAQLTVRRSEAVIMMLSVSV